ncbi:MAG: tRNA pseudouridine synthase A, partial [Eggerthellaceae bacterium]|nr:tRNA pseudouridine synthase A [Eggerthellaceae bacterium]
MIASLTLSYNGAPFCGFARQPGQLTVQGELERALELLFKREVPTTCAGRTDAGVHALGQVVSFELTDEEWGSREVRTLLRSLNAITHEAISIRRAEERPEGFSARFSAQAREYHYFICTEAAPPLVMRDFCWHRAGTLDLGAMNEGAAHLIGEHDFKSFCLASSA